MEDNRRAKLEKLVRIGYDNAINSVDLFICEETQRYIDFGFGYDEAEKEIFCKYRKQAINDTSIILESLRRYRSAYFTFISEDEDVDWNIFSRGNIESVVSELSNSNNIVTTFRYLEHEESFISDVKEKVLCLEIIDRLRYRVDRDVENDSIPEHLNYQQEIAQITRSENKFWKGFPMPKVVSHFEVLTTRNSKNGKPFLTTEQFISFLKRGFLNDDSQPKQIFNYARGEKGLIIKRFYDFFDLAATEYGHPQKKEKFVELFSHCFGNWNPTSVESFFKPDKVKESW